MVCASSAPPVTGPATTSVRWTSSVGITSSRSCAKRQIVDGDWQIRRENGDVGRRTVGQRPAGDPEHACRIDRQQLDQARQRNDAGMDEAIETQRDGGLEAGDAERRAIELHLLFISMVRR